MPRVFDNIETQLLPALKDSLGISERADFCVGYFNLRGWKALADYVERWAGEGTNERCRLLLGMQKLPHDELRESMSLLDGRGLMDNQAALRLKRRLAEEFRQQLALGAPNNEDEATLQRLARQIRSGKVVVKLFLRHTLHAKLYLLFRQDPNNPIVGFLGSSNLTLSGLSRQGELNVDVLDHDACNKLAKWFEDRWNDRWCVDISGELADIIDESWAREDLIPPYHIYLKMAYHLSQEARAGLTEFRIPRDFGGQLFDFQTAAVKIAAHHLNKRDGVLIGDVVGLGKTLMATALARIFEDDHGLETLILCPKNLVPMWEDYRDAYRLRARVVPISRVMTALPNLRRFRLLVLDESQNLRNREGKRYRAIQEYIRENESKCILLSATPYNKTYLDLSSQLRLFVPEDRDLGIRPERLIRELGETEFIRRHQSPVRSLAAFEHSEYPDDWRDLMRLFLVRRTGSFIKENYAETDPATGRKFLTYEDGDKSFFPDRLPRTVKFTVDETDPQDQYARMYAAPVVNVISNLNLPRYGLGTYIKDRPENPPNPSENKLLQDLSRGGRRLQGFCRINLFKRLESNGAVFIQSLERHILRNYVALHAMENGVPIPLGTQDAQMFDSRFVDEDADGMIRDMFEEEEEEEDVDEEETSVGFAGPGTPAEFQRLAQETYVRYTNSYGSRFRWLRPDLFKPELVNDLRKDCDDLLGVLKQCANWDPRHDTKAEALYELLTQKHPAEKVLIFTQFADTVDYLVQQLRKWGVGAIEGVTGDSANPTEIAWRFSPVSNRKRDVVSPSRDLRVVISTDILSEGQNLQDCRIVVNFDLPWAIIRLVQRAGRVDRIGQKASEIFCYSFLPADGVERLINLRGRVRSRLRENAEVVGTDEAFFEDDRNNQSILNLYNEKAGILDGDPDTEVDLASHAYQIWKNAIDRDPGLQKTVTGLPDVVFSSRSHRPSGQHPEGVLVFARTADGNDALAYVDQDGNSITESQFDILEAARCRPDTPAQLHDPSHHDLVKSGVEHIVREEKRVGGQLGRPSGARFRTYERLKRFADDNKGSLFITDELLRAIDDVYRYPLRQAATDTLNRQLRSGIDDIRLAELVVALRDEDRLCLVDAEVEAQEPRIICSLGLFENHPEGRDP